MLKDSGRVTYTSVRDHEALHAFRYLSKKEGIIPAMESSHAVAAVLRMKGDLGRDEMVVINLSGRGDKDLATVAGMEPGV